MAGDSVRLARGPRVVEVRGPCHRLLGRLDTKTGILQVKCERCSKRGRDGGEGEPVFHLFDVRTGMPYPRRECAISQTESGESLA